MARKRQPNTEDQDGEKQQNSGSYQAVQAAPKRLGVR
jgi:hypothetical protein